MKKLTVWIMIAVCALGLIGCAGKKTKPLQDLTAAEVSSATVFLQPPGETVEIKDISKLVDLLNDVILYEKDNSYTEYGGQVVTFQLNMADGTQTKIMAYNPFIVIDGVGYRTEDAPCEALNQFANELLEAEGTVG